jgi:tetratricopeptide (TPR) repeat protein
MDAQLVDFRRFGLLMFLLCFITPLELCQLDKGNSALAQESQRLKEKTIKELEELLENPYATESERFDAEFELGVRYERTEQYEKALEIYDSLIEKLRQVNAPPSQWVNVSYRKSLILYKLLRYPEAVVACQELFNRFSSEDLDPKIAAVLYYVLGTSEMKLGDPYKARAAFEEFIRLKPGSMDVIEKQQVAEVYFNLGVFRLKDGETDSATNAFEVVTALETELKGKRGKELVRRAYTNLAELARQQGDLQKYRDYLAKVAERLVVHEAKGRLVVDLAREAFDAGDDEWAQTLIDKTPFRRASSDIFIAGSLLRADILIRQGKLKEALYDLKRAIVLIEEQELLGEPVDEDATKRAYIARANALLKIASDQSQDGDAVAAKKTYAEASEAYKTAMHEIFGIYERHPIWAGDANLGEAEIAYYQKAYQRAAYYYHTAKQAYQQASQTTHTARLGKKLALATFGWADCERRTAETPYQYRYAIKAYEEAERQIQVALDDPLRSDLQKDILFGKAECYRHLDLKKEGTAVATQLRDIALEESPDISLLMQAADLLFDQEAYDEAAAAYQQALDLNADKTGTKQRLRLLTQLAFCFYHKAEQSDTHLDKASLQKAIAVYKTLLAEIPTGDPVLNNVWYNKALAHYKLGERDKARALFEQVLASDTTGGLAKLVIFPLAEIYEAAREFNDAIRVYEAAVKLYEGDEDALTLVRWRLGELYRGQADYPKAIDHYERLIAQYPASDLAARSRYFLGYCYEATDESQKAEVIYQDIFTNAPHSENWADATWRLVQFAKQRGALDRVIELCTRITERHDAAEELHLIQLVDGAKQEMAGVLESLPTQTDAERELWRKTLHDLAESGRMTDVEVASIYRKLARSYEDAGEFREALESLSQAKRFATANAEICYAQALIYSRLGDEENVVRACREALADNPTTELAVNVQYLRGVNAMKLDHVDESIDAFAAAAKLATSAGRVEIAAQSALSLGTLHEQKGQNTAAIEAFTHAKAHAQKWKAESPLEANAIINTANHRMAKLYESSDASRHLAQPLWEELIQATSDRAQVKAEALYKRAVYEAEQQNFSDARQNFELLLNEFVNDADANVQKMVADARARLPRIYQELQELDAAIRAAEEVVQQSPPANRAAAQFHLATLYHEKANQHQDEPETYTALVRQAGQMYDAAYTTAKNEGSTDEFKQKAAYQAGILLYRIEDYQGAIGPLEAFAQIAPNAKETAAVLDQLGWCYSNLATESRRKRTRNTYLKKATNAFLRLANDFPDYNRADGALYQAGVILMELGEHSRAFDAFEQLGQHYPQSRWVADALVAQGNFLFDQDEFVQSKAVFQKYLAKFSQNKGADAIYYRLALCHHQLGEAADALKICAIIQTQFPDSYGAARAQLDIAHDHYRNEKYQPAFDAYRRLTKAHFPGADGKLVSEAHKWLINTSDQLAYPLYKKAFAQNRQAERSQIEAEKRTAASEILDLAEQIQTKYPLSRYADSVTVLVGSAYQLLGQPQEAHKTFTEFINRKEGLQKPLDADTQKLVKFAKDRLRLIRP